MSEREPCRPDRDRTSHAQEFATGSCRIAVEEREHGEISSRVRGPPGGVMSMILTPRDLPTIGLGCAGPVNHKGRPARLAHRPAMNFGRPDHRPKQWEPWDCTFDAEDAHFDQRPLQAVGFVRLLFQGHFAHPQLEIYRSCGDRAERFGINTRVLSRVVPTTSLARPAPGC